jgi:hypoxanthine phosphoribosyltransferase
MIEDIDRILISKDKIAQRVRALAAEITASYDPSPSGLTLVTILSGSIIFLADLIRHLPIRMSLGLITGSSYRGATTIGGDPIISEDLDLKIAGVDVLLIDDILDTGRTLRMVTARLRELRPRSLKTCVLLRKPARAPRDLTADFIGFDVEDSFVVGYGLDYNGYYRNYPHIGVLRRDLYQKVS